MYSKMNTEKDIETLMRLGLSKNEARVYLSLAKSGPQNAQETAKTTNIARQDIYRITPKLLKKGLVEKTIAKPTKYKATTLKQSLRALLNQKNNELKKLKEAVDVLISDYDNSLKRVDHKSDFEFALIPAREAFMEKVRKSVLKSKKSLRIAASLKRFWQGLKEFEEARNRAIKRGVEIKIVTDRPNNQTLSDEFEMIRRRSNLMVRFVPEQPSAVVILVDNMEAFMITSPTADIREAPALWSDNPSFVTLANNYFEELWAKAS